MISSRIRDYLAAKTEFLSAPDTAFIKESLFDIDLKKEHENLVDRLKTNEIYEEMQSIAFRHKRYWESNNGDSDTDLGYKIFTDGRPLQWIEERIPGLQDDKSKLLNQLDAEVIAYRTKIMDDQTEDYMRVLTCLIKYNTERNGGKFVKEKLPEPDIVVKSIRLLTTVRETLKSPFYRHLVYDAFNSFLNLNSKYLKELKETEGQDILGLFENPRPTESKGEVKYSHRYVFSGMLAEVFKGWSVKKVFKAVVLVTMIEGGWIYCKKTSNKKTNETEFKLYIKDLNLEDVQTDLAQMDPESKKPSKSTPKLLDRLPECTFSKQLITSLFNRIKTWRQRTLEQATRISDDDLNKAFDLQGYIESILDLTSAVDAVNQLPIFKDGLQPATKYSDSYCMTLPIGTLSALISCEASLVDGIFDISVFDANNHDIIWWLAANCLHDSYVSLSTIIYHYTNSVIDCVDRDIWCNAVDDRLKVLNAIEVSLDGIRISRDMSDELRYQLFVRLNIIERILGSESNLWILSGNDLKFQAKEIVRVLERQDTLLEKIDILAFEVAHILGSSTTNTTIRSLGLDIHEVALETNKDSSHILEMLIFVFNSNVFSEKTERAFIKFVTEVQKLDQTQGPHDDKMVQITKASLKDLRNNLSILQIEQLTLPQVSSSISYTQSIRMRSRLTQVSQQAFWHSMVDNMLELCDQILTPDNVSILKDGLYVEAGQAIDILTSQDKNDDVSDGCRLTLDDRGYPVLPEHIKQKWHPLRRFKPEHKEPREDSVVSHRVWERIWEFVEFSHWKVWLWIMLDSDWICYLVCAYGSGVGLGR